MKIAELLEKIKAKTGFQPRMSGGQYIFRCPCHEDRSPSASARVANNGAILLHCYAGCPIEGICNAIGIEPKDLFPSSASLPSPTAAPPRKTYDTLEEAIKAATWGVGKRSPGAKLAKAWPYRDPDGNRYACQVRFEHPGGKTFAMISRISGGWALCGPERRWPLGCEKLGEPVHVVEGEKCVYALRAETGWSVTTSLGGSQSAQKTDWSCVAGKHVYIWPDNDEAGRKYAQTVAGILSGLNCDVYEVSVPGLAPGGDIADWLAERDSMDGEEIKNQLAEFVAKARRIGPQAAAESGTTDPDLKRNVASCTCLATVTPRDVQWLWDGVISLGTVTMICGDPGGGKSTLTLDLAARVSTGNPMPDGTAGVLGSALLMTAEDGLDTTVVPRLITAGADLNKIHSIDGRITTSDDGTKSIAPINADDVRTIEDAITRNGDARLLIVDPISAYLGAADSHNNSDIRGLLRPLAELAQRHSVAVVLVSHLTKAPGVKAAYRATGSLAFTALARAAWMVCDDPDNPGDRLFVCVKNNLGPSDTGWRFRRLVTGSLEWEQAGIKMTAAEALEKSESKRADGEPERGPMPEKRQACETWLSEYLGGGPKVAAELQQAAQDAGYSDGTIRRAKRNIGVVAFRRNVPGPWWCKLPDSQDAQPAHLDPHTENLRTLEKPARLVEKQGFSSDPKIQDAQDAQVFMSEHLGTGDTPPEPVAATMKSENMDLIKYDEKGEGLTL